MYGKIVGLRTLKGGDINYQEDESVNSTLPAGQHFTGNKIIFARR
jgi:hypothetical protein